MLFCVGETEDSFEFANQIGDDFVNNPEIRLTIGRGRAVSHAISTMLSISTSVTTHGNKTLKAISCVHPMFFFCAL